MAGPPSTRQQRVATLIREVLSELLQTEVKDPRVAPVTLTDVEVTGDLREARVYYTVPEVEEVRRGARAGLRSASGFLRRELGRRIRLRTLPTLDFRLDTSLEYAARIEQRLKELGLGEEAGPIGDEDGDTADDES